MTIFEEIRSMVGRPEFEQACLDWLKTSTTASLEEIRRQAALDLQHTCLCTRVCLACLNGRWIREALNRRVWSVHLRELGERDALAGKPIESFDDIRDISHCEEARAEYEKAYRGTDVELRREGH